MNQKYIIPFPTIINKKAITDKVQAMNVGAWASHECGGVGWPTEVVELRHDMTQDHVDKLVLPFLRLSPSGERLHVTVLPVKASAYITDVMVSSVPSGLYTPL
jgi:hypothetical protein